MIKQEQQMNFTLNMLKGLSFLQMNKIVLDLTIKKYSDSNPFIKTSANTVLPDIIEETLAYKKKLYEELQEELMLSLSGDDLYLLQLLIGNLNSSGFLEISCQELCHNTTLDAQHLESIRTLLLHSSYRGLGSYDIEEYFRFLTSEIYGVESIEYKLVSYLSKKLSINKLKNIFPNENIEQGLAHLKALPSSPLHEETIAILPDFIVKIKGDELSISQINYHKITIDTSAIDELRSTYTKTELHRLTSEANHLQNLLSLREDSLKKHAEALIIARRDFFFSDLDIDAPLSVQLKDIAQITGRHVSTVSRALKHRYFLFQNNIYPFSILWTHKIGSNNDASVKQKIQEIIAHETAPLSDEIITNILNKQGIKISRRTVTKYREQLNIGSTYQR